MKNSPSHSRSTRHVLERWLLAAASAASLVTTSLTAQAANITVSASCTLPAAVNAVNSQSIPTACNKAGTGSVDTINVPAGSFTIVSDVRVLRSVRIIGAGRTLTNIYSSSDNGLFAQAVANQGDGAPVLELQSLTVRQGSNPTPLATGVRARGPATVVLNNVRLRGFNGYGAFVGADFLGEEMVRSGVQITDSILEYNGTGIQTTQSDSTFLRSIIRNSDYTGFLNVNSSNNSDYCTFENNTGSFGAGIYVEASSGGRVYIRNSLIRNNAATDDGGGLYSIGQIYLYNTTITGNTASRGAGIFHNGAESYLFHTTIAYNTAATTGGGIWVAGGNKIYSFNIFANNTATESPNSRDAWVTGGGQVSAAYNLVGVRSSSTFPVAPSSPGNRYNVDPLLGALTSGSGPTQVYFPLQTGSPAIDRIPLDYGGLFAIDQRGLSRPVDGPDGAGRATMHDMGAIEQR